MSASPAEQPVPDNRCAHTPMSPGQSMCSCEDRRMWLELLVSLQARQIDVLTRRLENHTPKVIFTGDSS